MADIILVKDPLTVDMVNAGQAVIDALDAANYPPRAAFWRFTLDRPRWILFLVYADYSPPGSRSYFDVLHRVIGTTSVAANYDEYDITARQLTDLEIRPILRSTLRPMPGKPSRRNLGDDDALIYRLDLLPADVP